MPRLLQQSGAKKRRESKEKKEKKQAALIKVQRLDSFLTFYSQTARNEMANFLNGPEPPEAAAHAITSASARSASGDNGQVSVGGPDEFSVSVSLTSLSNTTLSVVHIDTNEVTIIEVNTLHKHDKLPNPNCPNGNENNQETAAAEGSASETGSESTNSSIDVISDDPVKRFPISAGLISYWVNKGPEQCQHICTSDTFKIKTLL